MLAQTKTAAAIHSVDRIELPDRPYAIGGMDINQMLRSEHFWFHNPFEELASLSDKWRVEYLFPLRMVLHQIVECGSPAYASKLISSHRLFPDRSILLAHIVIAICNNEWFNACLSANADIIIRYETKSGVGELSLTFDEGRWTIIDHPYSTSSITNGTFFLSH